MCLLNLLSSSNSNGKSNISTSKNALQDTKNQLIKQKNGTNKRDAQHWAEPKRDGLHGVPISRWQFLHWQRVQCSVGKRTRCGVYALWRDIVFYPQNHPKTAAMKEPFMYRFRWYDKQSQLIATRLYYHPNIKSAREHAADLLADTFRTDIKKIKVDRQYWKPAE